MVFHHRSMSYGISVCGVLQVSHLKVEFSSYNRGKAGKLC
jgi:hypothetical protein